jgi:hypothetical protein
MTRFATVEGTPRAVPSGEVPSSSLAAVLEPDYLAGLITLPIEEIRSRRDFASEVEVGLSYVRRLIQGRLDIVLAEVRRRETGEAESNIAELVERLPEILSDRVRAPGNGRLPTLMAPAEAELAEVERLNAIVNAEALGSLPERDDAALRGIADSLAELEHEVSGGRRAIHDVIDRLQDELVRRYKSGEAIVDTLLS